MNALDIQVSMMPSTRPLALALVGCLLAFGACANSEPGTSTPGSGGSGTGGTGQSNPQGVAGTMGSGGSNPQGSGGTTGNNP